MARSKPPAPWFRESVKREHALIARDDYVGAQLEYKRREQERDYLKESVKLLRRYATGYDSKDGFGLRDIAKLSGAKLTKLRKLAPIIRAELAAPHIEVSPRTKAQRDALMHYTGQTEIKGRKRFIVHVADPTVARVTVKKQRGGKPAVEVFTKYPKGEQAERFFLIADYAKKPPATFAGIRNVLRRMLKDMPKGWYTLVSKTHGNIAAPMQKHHLLEMLESDYFGYDKLPAGGGKDDRGLAETVLGFRLTSYTVTGAQREYTERLTRRDILRRERQNQRNKRRTRVRSRLR